MHTGPRAVFAAADISSAGHIADAIRGAGISICAFARSGSEVTEHVRLVRPDLLISDLILPGADGIDLSRRILALPLDRHPAILLLNPAGCLPSRDDWLWDCGVRIIPKIPDICMFKDALLNLTPEKRSMPPHLATRLAKLMDDLGVPEHPGRSYLADAVALAWMDNRFLDRLKSHLYTTVAHKYSTDASRVERAIRYAIDSAWRTGEIARQHSIFGYTIDARRGKPTCGEMIARLADILRWEGRQ